MPETSFKIEGLAELQAALKQFPEEVNRNMRTSMKGAIDQIKEDLADYPPLTEANQPRSYNSVFSMRTRRPNNTWYERGFGTHTVRSDGSVRDRKTSQILGRTWTTEVRGMFMEIRGIAGTRATYAQAVQDEEDQARFHAARGWPTVQGVFRKRFTWLQAFFGDQIRKILQRIARKG
jgi:hypothetical protein